MQRFNRRVFGALVFTLFASVCGVGIVVPLLPVYAHELGASGFAIGLIFSSFSFSRTALIPVFGSWSDHHGRKPLILVGLLLYSLISLAFMAASSVTALIVIRFFQGVASAMMMPAIQAYAGDIAPRGREGQTMGLFNMAMFLGLSLGPLCGGLIRDHAGLPVAFLAMGVLAMSAFLLCVLMLPATHHEHMLAQCATPRRWWPLLADRELAGLAGLKLCYAACIGVIWGFLPLLAATRHACSALASGVLVMLGVLVSGLLHAPMGLLADRCSKPRLMLCGSLLVMVAIQGYGWAGGLGGLATSSVLFGIGGGMAMPALMAQAVIAGQRLRAMGAVMALMTLAHSLGMLLGALLGGVAADRLQLPQAFTCGALLMLVGIAGFMLSLRRTPARSA